jgi:hypothetical protein
VTRIRCARGVCRVTVAAADASGIRRVEARITRRALRCRGRGARRRCRRVTVTVKRLRLRASSGRFTARVRLRPGAYTLSVRAVDRAGNAPRRSTRRTFRVRRPRR